VHFIREGFGSPPLIFVHGLACANDDWRAQVAHFRVRHDVVACDLRGHGQTPGRAPECTISSLGGDVAALIASLEYTGAILVGHSMGCRVVLEAARLAPARIGGLVLLDASMIGMGDRAKADAAIRQMNSLPDFATFAERLFSEMFLRESAVSRALIARAKALPADVGRGLYESLATWDVEHARTALAAVRVPLLAIQSTTVNAGMRRLPLKAGETTPWLDLVRDSVPGARIEVMVDAGHFPQIELPEGVNRLLAGFLAGLSR
jgi:pimeloyl-ACP methyl ester carboxylesterase